MKKSVSSKRWLKEHFDDQYVKASKEEGYRSRAVYKLKQIQEKYRLIKPGMIVVDLGAAPGGWSQLMTNWVGRKGKIFALDILPMDPLPDVDIIEGDFTEQAVLEQLQLQIEGRIINAVVSDMAPNMSGIKVSDQARAMYLAELALDFANMVLTQGGIFVCKLFQGEGFDAYIKKLRQDFTKLMMHKPDASRDRSREVFAIAVKA